MPEKVGNHDVLSGPAERALLVPFLDHLIRKMNLSGETVYDFGSSLGTLGKLIKEKNGRVVRLEKNPQIDDNNWHKGRLAISISQLPYLSEIQLRAQISAANDILKNYGDFIYLFPSYSFFSNGQEDVTQENVQKYMSEIWGQNRGGNVDEDRSNVVEALAKRNAELIRGVRNAAFHFTKDEGPTLIRPDSVSPGRYSSFAYSSSDLPLMIIHDGVPSQGRLYSIYHVYGLASQEAFAFKQEPFGLGFKDRGQLDAWNRQANQNSRLGLEHVLSSNGNDNDLLRAPFIVLRFQATRT